MEKYSNLISPTYHFTDQFAEAPDFLLARINKVVAVDFKKEKFVAACWIQNIFGKGKIFTLVTSERTVYADLLNVRQNLFRDMTGVERNLSKNINLLSPGNATILFPANALPTSKLLDRLFIIIQQEWIRAKQAPVATAAAAAPAGNDVLVQIEQLNELKNKGILTDAEFQSKKQELLAKL